jgi:hypothetical protein
MFQHQSKLTNNTIIPINPMKHHHWKTLKGHHIFVVPNKTTIGSPTEEFIVYITIENDGDDQIKSHIQVENQNKKITGIIFETTTTTDKKKHHNGDDDDNTEYRSSQNSYSCELRDQSIYVFKQEGSKKNLHDVGKFELNDQKNCYIIKFHNGDIWIPNFEYNDQMSPVQSDQQHHLLPLPSTSISTREQEVSMSLPIQSPSPLSLPPSKEKGEENKNNQQINTKQVDNTNTHPNTATDTNTDTNDKKICQSCTSKNDKKITKNMKNSNNDDTIDKIKKKEKIWKFLCLGFAILLLIILVILITKKFNMSKIFNKKQINNNSNNNNSNNSNNNPDYLKCRTNSNDNDNIVRSP